MHLHCDAPGLPGYRPESDQISIAGFPGGDQAPFTGLSGSDRLFQRRS